MHWKYANFPAILCKRHTNTTFKLRWTTKPVRFVFHRFSCGFHKSVYELCTYAHKYKSKMPPPYSTKRNYPFNTDTPLLVVFLRLYAGWDWMCFVCLRVCVCVYVWETERACFEKKNWKRSKPSANSNRRRSTMRRCMSVSVFLSNSGECMHKGIGRFSNLMKPYKCLSILPCFIPTATNF